MNLTSPKAHVPGHGYSAYAASKGGVESFSRALALEGAPSVRVNVVSPGGPIVADGPTEPDTDASLAAALASVPMARLGRPEILPTRLRSWCHHRLPLSQGRC